MDARSENLPIQANVYLMSGTSTLRRDFVPGKSQTSTEFDGAFESAQFISTGQKWTTMAARSGHDYIQRYASALNIHSTTRASDSSVDSDSRINEYYAGGPLHALCVNNHNLEITLANQIPNRLVVPSLHNSHLFVIIHTLKSGVFSEELFTEPMVDSLLRVMMASEPEIRTKLTSMNMVSIDILYKATLQHLGKNVGKMDIRDEYRLVFEAAFVLLYEQLSLVRNRKFINMTGMLEKYPEFGQDWKIDNQERCSLLSFRNHMVLCLSVIPAQQHKNHLMELVTRLAEGRNVKYIVGSGQSDKTSRRVLIYRREGNVRLIPKLNCDSPPNAPVSGCPPVEVLANLDCAGTSSDTSASCATCTAFMQDHKLEKKRYKHWTYMEPELKRQQTELRQSNDDCRVETLEVLQKVGDKFKYVVISNVISYRCIT
jgi:hypothetical protein